MSEDIKNVEPQKKSPTYWACRHYWDNENKLDEFLSKGIWWYGQPPARSVIDNVKEGDYFLLLGRKKKFEAIGRVVKHTEERGKFEVDYLPIKLDLEDRQRGQCEISAIDDSEKDKNIIDAINKILREYEDKKMELQNKCKNLLEHSHNIILHGAPGTGKTYLAKQIAESMGAETCFVQFHPSYDYTDFVEGLRPVNKEGSKEIGFERKDGIFKTFCKKALNSDNFESVFTNYVEQIKDGEEAKISENATIKITKDDIEVVQQQGEGSNQSILIKKESLAKYLRTCVIDNPEQEQYIKVLAEKLKEKGYKKKNCVFIIDEINRGELSKIFGELFFSIDPGYRGTEGAVKTQYSNMQQKPNEFDKALGVSEDKFKQDDCGHFFVPENVYIIGTMNDIDRNVESMDFAFRRRFAFKEITAEETKNMLDNHKGLNGTKIEETVIEEKKEGTVIKTTVIDRMKNRMNNLNNAISGNKVKDKDGKEIEPVIDGLSSAYHIGASYFLKFKLPSDYKDKKEEKENAAFKDLWNYHLEPLLQEYLRGMEDADKKLESLKKAYNKEEVKPASPQS